MRYVRYYGIFKRGETVPITTFSYIPGFTLFTPRYIADKYGFFKPEYIVLRLTKERMGKA